MFVLLYFQKNSGCLLEMLPSPTCSYSGPLLHSRSVLWLCTHSIQQLYLNPSFVRQWSIMCSIHRPHDAVNHVTSIIINSITHLSPSQVSKSGECCLFLTGQLPAYLNTCMLARQYIFLLRVAHARCLSKREKTLCR